MENGYLINGECVSVIAEVPGKGFIVRHTFIDDDGEEYTEDGDYFVKEVFEKPPTQKYEQKITELQKIVSDMEAKRTDLSNEIYKLKSEKQDADKREKELFASLKRVNALEYLEDFIKGKITHYVEFVWNGPKVTALKDSKSKFDRDSLKLLTLFGKEPNDLQWKLNEYSDGSGSNSEVIPCRSEEEALDKIKNRLIEESSKGLSSSLIANCRMFGVPIDQNKLSEFNEKLKVSINKRIEENARISEKLREELDAVK